ncbi:MBL fold metallo-hydrolase [Phycicoccus avicenniae]|uniref:MBL fold metallo-hydrolase n=1 Tax=Phycicoccus avicenniae TaxID=2828860 RepID=UPI003D27545F
MSPTEAPALTVLGSCGGTPEPGRACAGMLLEFGDLAVVLDLGYGTLPALLDAVGDVRCVAGVVLTHRHPDHVSDASGLLRVLRYHAPEHLPWLAAAEGVIEVLAAVEPEAWSDGPPVPVLPLPGMHDVEGLRLTAVTTPHWVPHAAVRVDVGDRSVVYSADGGIGPCLAALAAGTDLLVCGVTERAAPGVPAPAEDAENLMTARAAGELAETAGVGTLLLTHFWPGTDRERAASEARAKTSATVLVADEALVVPVTRRP